MANEIRDYKNSIKQILADNLPDTDWNKLSEQLLIRIGFYQHERLIHLIVTMTFAIMFIMSFLLIPQNIAFIALTILLLCLLAPYIYHYYFLENSVQELYRIYYQVIEKADADQ